jgi:drug/metabolite transporter (DMT)-like permease
LVIFITLVAALIASVSQLLYKNGIRRELVSVHDFLALATNRAVLLGGLGYVLSLVVYLYALQAAPLSVVYPIFASSFIFVSLISALVLKERIGKLRIAGVALVFIGISIIAVSAI